MVLRAHELLMRTGLSRPNQKIETMSRGEMQRVAIARALVHRPKLILADEPTGNLDPETADRILALFAEQVRDSGATALLVTHSDVAGSVADRVLTLTRDGLVDRHGA
jgi:putative ABC transport system ATP-binding protein